MSLCPSTSSMEKDKVKPHSQPPRSFPGSQRAKAWSGQQEETQRGSEVPRRGRRGALHEDLLFVQFDIEEEPEIIQGEVNQNQQGTPGEGCAEPGDARSPQQLSDWDEGLEPELCQEESGSYWDFSGWEEGREQELSQGDKDPGQELLNREESPEQRMSPGEGTSCRGLSEWDACSKQELSQEETRSQEVSEGTCQRKPSEQSSWEYDSDQELRESSSVLSPWLKAWLREKDNWDKISILELNEEDKEAKCQAPEPCHQERLHAGPGTSGQAPVGHHSCPGQGVPHKKRLWLSRRELRGLFRCSCLAAQPED